MAWCFFYAESLEFLCLSFFGVSSSAIFQRAMKHSDPWSKESFVDFARSEELERLLAMRKVLALPKALEQKERQAQKLESVKSEESILKIMDTVF